MSRSKYENIYKQVAEHISQEAPNVFLEDSRMAGQCCVGISKKALFSLNNKDFAINLYCKILDRPPRSADVKSIASRLKLGTTSKQKELQKVLGSAEYSNKAIKVKVLS